MVNNILEMVCVDEMYNIITADNGGVWHIYEKAIDNCQVIITFCKYITGLSCIQSQAVIFIDDWKENRAKFEKLAYISEI